MTRCRVCAACCDCADLNDLMNVVPFLSPVFCESSNLCRQCWGIREKCKVVESQQIHHCTTHWSPTFLSLFLKSTASLKLLSGGTTFCIETQHTLIHVPMAIGKQCDTVKCHIQTHNVTAGNDFFQSSYLFSQLTNQLNIAVLL